MNVLPRCFPALFPILLSVLMMGCTTPENEFDLRPNQSMLITGLGEGQDATKNPYFGQPCLAKVTNLSRQAFNARVATGDESKTFPVPGGSHMTIALEADSRLILDSVDPARARVEFVPAEPTD